MTNSRFDERLVSHFDYAKFAVVDVFWQRNFLSANEAKKSCKSLKKYKLDG